MLDFLKWGNRLWRLEADVSWLKHTTKLYAGDFKTAKLLGSAEARTEISPNTAIRLIMEHLKLEFHETPHSITIQKKRPS